MTSSVLEKAANDAFLDDEFELAVSLYTQALELAHGSADLFADRAQANIKLNKFTEAVADANKAIELDRSKAKAYLRKGTACMKLKEYQTAKVALEAGASVAPENLRFVKLIKECDAHIAEVTINSTKAPPSSVSPSPSLGKTNGNKEESPPSSVSPSLSLGKTNGNKEESSLSAQDTSSVTDVPKPKYRHDYYNSSTEVVMTIFAKSIPPENVSVDFGEQTLRVVIDLPGKEAYHFQTRLFGKIIPSKCRYTVLSSKVEVHLCKTESICWTSLEYNEKKAIPQKINVSSAQNSQRPLYPSSKSKIDWDKLEAEVKKEEKEEKLDGDAAVNKIFQTIYKDSDEDTRRAMSKSFVESNGTVLSTNWKEVGSKTVEGSAPEGLEMKKWEI